MPRMYNKFKKSRKTRNCRKTRNSRKTRNCRKTRGGEPQNQPTKLDKYKHYGLNTINKYSEKILDILDKMNDAINNKLNNNLQFKPLKVPTTKKELINIINQLTNEKITNLYKIISFKKMNSNKMTGGWGDDDDDDDADIIKNIVLETMFYGIVGVSLVVVIVLLSENEYDPSNPRISVLGDLILGEVFDDITEVTYYIRLLSNILNINDV